MNFFAESNGIIEQALLDADNKISPIFELGLDDKSSKFLGKRWWERIQTTLIKLRVTREEEEED